MRSVECGMRNENSAFRIQPSAFTKRAREVIYNGTSTRELR
jgi:hypothetical protein